MPAPVARGCKLDLAIYLGTDQLVGTIFSAFGTPSTRFHHIDPLPDTGLLPKLEGFRPSANLLTHAFENIMERTLRYRVRYSKTTPRLRASKFCAKVTDCVPRARRLPAIYSSLEPHVHTCYYLTVDLYALERLRLGLLPGRTGQTCRYTSTYLYELRQTMMLEEIKKLLVGTMVGYEVALFLDFLLAEPITSAAGTTLKTLTAWDLMLAGRRVRYRNKVELRLA
ncbi:jg16003 [Pararge aegeria aegeria]|uniref:Jg16003 protein n=1 Tax=Pararge aegeria aegeria TaxID=348720 RepID=A0A8S4SMU6_9NEOP|nr:jg16003 [Pararge aegeria aegeria]